MNHIKPIKQLMVNRISASLVEIDQSAVLCYADKVVETCLSAGIFARHDVKLVVLGIYGRSLIEYNSKSEFLVKNVCLCDALLAGILCSRIDNNLVIFRL